MAKGENKKHLAVWIVSAVVYFIFVLPFLRIAALDFEALIFNLYSMSLVDEAIAPYGRAAILFGAAPLFIIGLAGIFYRFFRCEIPLKTLSVGLKAVLGSILYVAFLVFSLAFSVAAAVWISVETVWWIEWIDDVRPAVNDILIQSPPVIFLLFAGFGLVILFAAFGKRSPDPKKIKDEKKLAKIAKAFFTSFFILAMACIAAGSLFHAFKPASSFGISTFENKCGQCHLRSRPLYFIKTPSQWERTVTRMKDFEKAPIDKSEKKNILSLLTGMRSFSDAWTFRTRCKRCHGDSFEKRKPDEWAKIVKRVGRYSPYYYEKDVQDQVAAHLGEVKSDPRQTFGLTEPSYERFHALADICLDCHSVSRDADMYREADTATVAAMIERMSIKLNRPLTGAEIDSATFTYSEMIGDPEKFDKLFPHDKPAVWEGGE